MSLDLQQEGTPEIIFFKHSSYRWENYGLGRWKEFAHGNTNNIKGKILIPILWFQGSFHYVIQSCKL